MADDPQTEGQVVYRRIAPQPPPAAARRGTRLDPTVLPLFVGFAVLLLLILVLGNLSVRRVEDTSRLALEKEQTHLARTRLLLQLRVFLTQLDNEAAKRREAESRREIRPPLDVGLDTARRNVADQLKIIEEAHLSDLPNWQQLREALSTYVEVTRDRSQFTLKGYETYKAVDRILNAIIDTSATEQEHIFAEADAQQQSATRTIRLWNVIALIAGLLVAMATIWQVQRRFRQTWQSTEAARREREFSNQMLEGMVSAIAAIDRNDRIRSANTAFLRIFPRAAVGASIHDQLSSPEGVKLLEAATASHVDHATYRGRWQLEPEGTPVTFDVYSSPLEIGGERGQILTLVDVTEAAKSEAALRRSESLAAVGSAAAQLAHEIKNPLGSIRLGVEMLRQYTDSPDAEKTISLVERGIHHLNKLVVDVTQFSRHRQLELAPADLHEVIESSLELVMDRVHEKETPVTTKFDAHEIRGEWDSEQLREVFVNLVANAIDASPAKSPVEISTEYVGADGDARPVGAAVTSARNSRVVVLVKDYGSGMSDKTRARLFEPFYTTKKRGTGLGLSIVRQIVEMHGGTIDVHSAPQKGTTFRIELPLGEATYQKPDRKGGQDR